MMSRIYLDIGQVRTPVVSQHIWKFTVPVNEDSSAILAPVSDMGTTNLKN